MTRSMISPWYKAVFPATSWAPAEIAEIDPRYAALIVGDLEPRKARGLWASDEDWAVGYEGICRTQEALLMGGVEYLARVIFYAMGYPRDVALAADRFPAVELPEATLFAIRTRLGDPGDLTIYSRVEAIRALLEANEGADAAQLEQLVQIVALLTA